MLALLPFLAVAQTSFTFDHVVAISAVGVSGRSATHTDAVEAAVVDGSFQPPHAGDVVHLPNGRTATWRDAVADKTGNFSGDAFSGGYAFATYDARQPEVMILEAAGHSMVYVN
ncbi:MAG TPA: hypothetical protein VFG65_08635, partial [Fimbriimonadales bacterium]|nr:hypothetical protein [Fimbriimonadales bacterium]